MGCVVKYVAKYLSQMKGYGKLHQALQAYLNSLVHFQ